MTLKAGGPERDRSQLAAVQGRAENVSVVAPWTAWRPSGQRGCGAGGRRYRRARGRRTGSSEIERPVSARSFVRPAKPSRNR